jgi:flavin reductase (DIM6/NTAB) family NADH-FMN oxidoreductase RutF
MDTETKKKVLRQISYGLYVMTATAGEEMAAATVTWLSQASFDPPLVMVAVRNGSHLHALVDRARAFAINIVGQGQADMAAAFFRPSRVENSRISGYAFDRGPETGAPLLVDLPAWFEARVTDMVARGDHTVYVAEVVEVGLRNPAAKPLELSNTDWSYGG